jgi:hypothetical protein
MSSREEAIKKQKKKIKDRESGGNLIFFKADTTTRLRSLPVPEDEPFGLEIVYFYLGADLKGFISPMTFGEPCAVYDEYQRMKEEGNEGDENLLKSLKPKTKYVAPFIKYKDAKGKEVDDQGGEKLALLTGGQYEDMIDYFMDDEHGDFTDMKDGYDLKFSREGKGQFDTTYSVMNCKPSKLPKKYCKVYDIEEMVRKEIPTFEETQDTINSFLGVDEKPKKKKSKKDKFKEDSKKGKKKVIKKKKK